MAAIIVSADRLDDYILTLEVALQNLPSNAAPSHAKRIQDLIYQLKFQLEKETAVQK